MWWDSKDGLRTIRIVSEIGCHIWDESLFLELRCFPNCVLLANLPQILHKCKIKFESEENFCGGFKVWGDGEGLHMERIYPKLEKPLSRKGRSWVPFVDHGYSGPCYQKTQSHRRT